MSDSTPHDLVNDKIATLEKRLAELDRQNTHLLDIVRDILIAAGAIKHINKLEQSLRDPTVVLEEEYLLAHGWEHPMTDENGVDTWSYPWELRPEWPDAIRKRNGTQHYWDRPDAAALQREIDDAGTT